MSALFCTALSFLTFPPSSEMFSIKALEFILLLFTALDIINQCHNFTKFQCIYYIYICYTVNKSVQLMHTNALSQ
jgi:hypothetical protein